MNDELVTLTESAFILFYKAYLEENKDRILQRDLPDRPSWEELTSTKYAKLVFHDMILETLYDGMVKGRHWE